MIVAEDGYDTEILKDLVNKAIQIECFSLGHTLLINNITSSIRDIEGVLDCYIHRPIQNKILKNNEYFIQGLTKFRFTDNLNKEHYYGMTKEDDPVGYSK